MPIVFARVDDRLIHGQIVQAWLPELNVDEIVIPCLSKSGRNVNEGLLRLCLPYEYDLKVLDARKAVAYLADTKKRIFLLLGSLDDLNPLIEDGLQIKSLNIGGMHFKQGAQKLAENVFLDAKDKLTLRILSDLGIQIETRAVPNAQSVSVKEAI